MSFDDKVGKLFENKFFSISIVVNIFVFPLAYFIGCMGTDAAENQAEAWEGFLFGFLLLQGIPLLMLITSIGILIKGKMSISKTIK
ncbi:hypothetical protein J5Y03_11540 [Bacillus sp. RG28]|uniref:Uncharacterized protein n=1 Tax=Gottfriedia endophytica TaxID=2820819 RepID=A0A940NP86_9BACI|nr:hypothetical protein [Gottfriedia endophytica]MBP0725804.1 hypothetical protein [Gottfriedia endophytica]